MSVSTSTNSSGSRIKFLSVNQTQTVFCAGFKNKVLIYTLDPLKSIHELKDPCCFKFVEMFWDSNIIGIVGREKKPNGKFRPTTLSLYDFIQKKVVCELKFKTNITNVKFSGRTRIVVSLKDIVLIFKFGDSIVLLQKFETNNPLGKLSVSAIANDKEKKRMVACFPDPEKIGKVVVVSEYDNGKFKTIKFPAHVSTIACMSLNLRGSLLATSSRKGTLIRVFTTNASKRGKKSIKLQELRRGSDQAKVHSISFRNDDRYLCVTSNKQTTHIFGLNCYNGNKWKTKNIKSWRGERSFATYKFSDEKTSYESNVNFFSKDNNHVLIITCKGKIYKIKLDFDNGGVGELSSYKEF